MLNDAVLDRQKTQASQAEAGSIANQQGSMANFENLVRDKTTNYLKNAQPGEIYNLLRADFEKPLFEAVMAYTNNNQVQAAKILGISRGTLRKRLKEFGML